MNTMFFFPSTTEIRTLEVIYNYMKLDILTNPECSFLSNRSALYGGKTISEEQDNVPETFRDFKRIAFSEDWDACLCVAGTDPEDLRRVVVTYSRDLNKVAINFPSASNGFSNSEVQIREWLERELGT